MNSGGFQSSPKPISVVGIGNVLLGDDGFGPLTVELFRCRYECGSDVEVLDLGTPGLDLAPYLYGQDLVILVDAVHADEPPGTLCIFSEDDLLTHHALLRLSAHDPAVRESLAHLSMVGRAPSELILVGVVPEQCEFASGISASVMTTAPVAVDTIARLLGERGIECHPRDSDLQPNLWWLPVEHLEVATSS
jgi:hydrogenase maturation protease